MATKAWFLVAIPFLVGAVTAARAPYAPHGEPRCAVEARWVKEHPDSLPRTLDGISKFTIPRRKAIWTVLPREVRIAMRHEQNEHYLRSPDLNAAQRAFIARVDGNLDALMREGTDSVRMQYMRDARALFGFKRAETIFTTIGYNEDDDAGSAQSALTAHGPNILAGDERVWDCYCVSGDACFGGGRCGQTYFGCNTQIWGCGFLGYSRCDGVCEGDG